MGFIDDPDQFEDFPQDPDDYESQGYQELDSDADVIIEVFTKLGYAPDDDYVDELVQTLIVDGGLEQFALDMEDYGDVFKPPNELKQGELRRNIFANAGDAYNYLERIPGFAGFAGMTFVNGVWRIWVGETQPVPVP